MQRTIALWPILADGRCGCGDEQCRAAGKHPDITGVERPGAGSGIETGGGLLVVDIDCKKGVDGYASLDGRDMPDTYAVKTPTGGAHLYYSYDPEIHVGNRVGVLPGVDIRADGGMVVAAGSPHACGGVYQVAHPGPVAPCPEWLLALARTPVVDVEVPVPLALDDPTFAEMVERCVRELEAIPPVADGPGGHNTMFVAAQIPVRKYRLPLDMSEQLLLEHYVPRGAGHDGGGEWTPKEIHHKVQQAALRGGRAIGTHDWLSKLTNALVGEKDEQGYSFEVGQPHNTAAQKISLSNVLNILLTHEAWRGVWRYDEFSDKKIAINPPMKLDAETIGLTDVDITRVINWFEIHGYSPSRDNVIAAIETAQKANAFHSVRDYLDALPEPTTYHLENLAATIYGDTSLWAQKFLKNTLVQAVRRIRNPGCPCDYTIVLVGGQGVGKTKSVSALFGHDFTNESLPSLQDEIRACQALRGSWAIVVDELHAIRNHAATEAVKTFLTRRVDQYIPKYGRNPIRIPRSCIFFGTTNEVEFLHDKTGNRRFLPISIKKTIDREWIEAHRDEIWAEANALAATDFRAYFTPEEDALIDEETRCFFEEKDAWYKQTFDFVTREYKAGKRLVTVEEVYLKLEPNAAHHDMRGIKRIVGCLKQAGCIQRRIGRKKIRIWELPDLSGEEMPELSEAERTLDAAKKLAN